jgi:alpha-L-fucosidase
MAIGQSRMNRQLLVEVRIWTRTLAITTLLASMTTYAAFRALAVDAPAEWQNLLRAKPEAVEAWKNMRFGMFIHWGPVSLTGTEISWSRGAQVPIEKYDNLYKEFNPTNFNAAAWVKTAKDAGMKYMVLTTKHHDGFCLWDTKQTDYNIMNSPFRRDVVKELAAACKKAGIAFGTYYSTCDWHHPNFPGGGQSGSVKNPEADIEKYTEYLKAQTTELIKNYGPLFTLWFDVPQHFDAKRGQGVIDLLRGLQPDIVINNRTGAAGDYDTPEQKIGGFNMERPWETCMTICQQWAWKPNDNMKSLQRCLRTLVTTAGGDGNLLFNVGPEPTGEIEARQVERLNEMGAWLKKYGESIYGTRGGPFKPGKYGAATRKGNTIYLHAFNWTGDSLTLPAIPAKILRSKALTGGNVTVKQADDAIEISLPASDRQEIDTIVAMELDRPAIEIQPLTVRFGPQWLTVGKKTSASNVFEGRAEYGADKAVDDSEETRWATDAGTNQAWLEVNLDKPVTFTRAVIDESHAGRVQRFEMQYKDGDNWRTFHKGTTIGVNCSLTFGPVTAQYVRLNILDATEGPTIAEFHLLSK